MNEKVVEDDDDDGGIGGGHRIVPVDDVPVVDNLSVEGVAESELLLKIRNTLTAYYVDFLTDIGTSESYLIDGDALLAQLAMDPLMYSYFFGLVLGT